MQANNPAHLVTLASDGAERRRHKRYAVNAEAGITLMNARSARVRAVDISLMGIGLISSVGAEINDSVKGSVVLILDDQEFRIIFEGIIRFSQFAPKQAIYRLGLEFVSMTPTAVLDLQDYLSLRDQQN